MLIANAQMRHPRRLKVYLEEKFYSIFTLHKQTEKVKEMDEVKLL